jgi:hypothetical protein
MSLPALAVYSDGGAPVTGDNLNTFVQTAQTAAQLRNLSGQSGMAVMLQGITQPSDGGGGLFFWDALATDPDDNFSTIVAWGTYPGAWVRVATSGSTVAGVSAFNGRIGAVNLLSSDVIAALGYTPYSTANPSLYQTASQVAAAIAAAAYTLPTASTSVLGGVRIDGTSITITAGVISAVQPAASTTTPLMDGTATVGALTTYARADHIHPTDTSRYAASNPSGYQTAAQVAASIAAAAYTLPVATNTVLGGVKPDGTTLTNTSGAISVTYGTSANTAAQGNDSRITGALSATTAAATYAPLASPALTGTPTAPTATAGTNTTQIATTAFVGAAITAGAYVLPTASTTVLGGVKIDGTTITIAAGVISAVQPAASSTTPLMDGTAAVGTSATYARADHVHPTDTSRAPLASPTFTGTVTIPSGASIVGYALLASPTFTGTPAAPTATAGTNTTQLATTAFVTTAVANVASSTTPLMDGTAAVGTGTTYARADHVHPTDTSRAPLASPTFTGTVTIPTGASIAGYALLAGPAFTGTPTAPTATGGNNSTQLATTAYVYQALTNAAAISTTGGSTTLTAVQYGGPILVVSGTLTSNATLVTPNNGLWVVSNRTSGAFTLTVKTSAGTGIVVDQGTTAVLIADGTNVVLAQTDYNSIALLGTPTTPTATFGTNTTQIASTAFVQAALPVASSTTPLMDGTAAVGTGTTWARADHVHPTDTSRAPLASPTFTGTVTIPGGASISGYALLASPTFTGTPAAPTATAGTNTTQIATTAFVTAAISAGAYVLPTATATVLGGVKPDGTTITNTSGAISVTYGTGANTAAQGNDSRITGALSAATAATTYAPIASPTFTGTVTIPTGASIAGYALLLSPAFTGTPTAPTASAGTNTTQLATTAFVTQATANASGISTTGGSTTLTATQYGVPVLLVTGTLTSNATLVVPNNGVWTVSNRTSGAFSLTVKTSAGTGVAVDQGTTAILFADGTNVVFSQTDYNAISLLGVSTAPTASPGTNTTQIATTAFVTAAITAAAYVLPTATASVLGGVKPDGTTITNSAGAISVTYGTVANTAAQGNDSRIVNALSTSVAASTYAPLASPTFTGTVTIPGGTINNTPIGGTTASTGAFTTLSASGTVSGAGFTTLLAPYAPLASPALTGTPTAPTATGGTNTTQLATTAYVQAATANAAAISTTGGSTTLTAAQYGVPVLLVTGTLTSNATLVVPNNGVWTVANRTSGAFSLTVKTSAGTGVIVDQGTNLELFADGTNVVTSTTDFNAIALLGVSTAPTATAGTNTTQIATTAFVQTAVPVASSTTPVMDGTAAVGVGTTWARADHVHPTDTSRAPLASPTFTGTPAAPTATAGTNTTQLATTAFVQTALPVASSTTPAMDGTATIGVSTTYARADHIHPTDTTRAPLASPTFTGTPAAPTAAAGTNTTQMATTAYVYAATTAAASISTTGGSTTLTAAQYGNPILLVTGTLTSNATLVVPNNGAWTVANRTTGAFTLTVKTSAGTGIVIDQGTNNEVIADGTNVVQSTTDFNAIALLGVCTAPTAAQSTATTQIATTAFVRTGTATNDNASAGQVGEYISATVLVGSAVSLTTATSANVTSISLTAGDWEVTGSVCTNPATTTSTALLSGAISTTSATLPTLPGAGGYAVMPGGVGTGITLSLPVGVMRLSLASTTTVYLVINCRFAVSTMGGFGFIGARRMR